MTANTSWRESETIIDFRELLPLAQIYVLSVAVHSILWLRRATALHRRANSSATVVVFSRVRGTGPRRSNQYIQAASIPLE